MKLAEEEVFVGSVDFGTAADVIDEVPDVKVELEATADVREESSFSVEESRFGKITDFRAEKNIRDHYFGKQGEKLLSMPR